MRNGAKSMKQLATILVITLLSLPVLAQRNPDLPFREDGKWYFNLENKKYGPYHWVSNLNRKDKKWFFISELKDENGKSTYFANTNASEKGVYGPYDYINYRISGISPGGKHFYFMGFKGNKETSDQKYFFVVDGKEYGPYTSLTRKIQFFCNDEIWTFKAVRDGKFRGRWHTGGKDRLYVMGKEYDILTKPAGFWVESAKKISENKYELKVAVDVGSRRKIKTIYYEK